MSNVWGALMIESVPGGGYIVREHQYRAELYSQHLFACSQKSELLTFIQNNLATTDVAFPSTEREAQ